MFKTWEKFFWLLLLVLPGQSYGAVTELSTNQKNILEIANYVLELSQISYVYGGSKVGSHDECQQCQKCLLEAQPTAKDRLAQCMICKNCSLDCSHFTYLVFKKAGLFSAYLSTQLMIDLTAQHLFSRYKFIDLKQDVHAIKPADLLVYKGHVAMVENITKVGIGDVIHATGGRDIKLPGQAIQRERYVRFESFRGTLLRILRHRDLVSIPVSKR